MVQCRFNSTLSTVTTQTCGEDVGERTASFCSCCSDLETKSTDSDYINSRSKSGYSADSSLTGSASFGNKAQCSDISSFGAMAHSCVADLSEQLIGAAKSCNKSTLEFMGMDDDGDADAVADPVDQSRWRNEVEKLKSPTTGEEDLSVATGDEQTIETYFFLESKETAIKTATTDQRETSGIEQHPITAPDERKRETPSPRVYSVNSRYQYRKGMFKGSDSDVNTSNACITGRGRAAGEQTKAGRYKVQVGIGKKNDRSISRKLRNTLSSDRHIESDEKLKKAHESEVRGSRITPGVANNSVGHEGSVSQFSDAGTQAQGGKPGPSTPISNRRSQSKTKFVGIGRKRRAIETTSAKTTAAASTAASHGKTSKDKQTMKKTQGMKKSSRGSRIPSSSSDKYTKKKEFAGDKKKNEVLVKEKKKKISGKEKRARTKQLKVTSGEETSTRAAAVEKNDLDVSGEEVTGAAVAGAAVTGVAVVPSKNPVSKVCQSATTVSSFLSAAEENDASPFLALSGMSSGSMNGTSSRRTEGNIQNSASTFDCEDVILFDEKSSRTSKEDEIELIPDENDSTGMWTMTKIILNGEEVIDKAEERNTVLNVERAETNTSRSVSGDGKKGDDKGSSASVGDDKKKELDKTEEMNLAVPSVDQAENSTRDNGSSASVGDDKKKELDKMEETNLAVPSVDQAENSSPDNLLKETQKSDSSAAEAQEIRQDSAEADDKSVRLDKAILPSPQSDETSKELEPAEMPVSEQTDDMSTTKDFGIIASFMSAITNCLDDITNGSKAHTVDENVREQDQNSQGEIKTETSSFSDDDSQVARELKNDKSSSSERDEDKEVESLDQNSMADMFDKATTRFASAKKAHGCCDSDEINIPTDPSLLLLECAADELDNYGCEQGGNSVSSNTRTANQKKGLFSFPSRFMRQRMACDILTSKYSRDTVDSDTDGSDTTGSHTVGSNSIGSHTSGSHTEGSDSNTVGSETVGSKTLGSKTVASKTVGSNTTGSKTTSQDTTVSAHGGGTHDKRSKHDPNTAISIDDGKPIDVDDGKPIDIDNGKPIDIDDGKPIDIDDGKPIDIDDGKPIDIDDGKPIDIDDGKPIDIEDGKPVNPGDRNSTNIGDQKSTDFDEGKPITIDDVRFDEEIGHSNAEEQRQNSMAVPDGGDGRESIGTISTGPLSRLAMNSKVKRKLSSKFSSSQSVGNSAGPEERSVLSKASASQIQLSSKGSRGSRAEHQRPPVSFAGSSQRNNVRAPIVNSVSRDDDTLEYTVEDTLDSEELKLLSNPNLGLVRMPANSGNGYSRNETAMTKKLLNRRITSLMQKPRVRKSLSSSSSQDKNPELLFGFSDSTIKRHNGGDASVAQKSEYSF